MRKNKFYPVKMKLRVIYNNGDIETIEGLHAEIKMRFYKLVSDCLPSFVDGLHEIQLLDSHENVLKSYLQNY